MTAVDRAFMKAYGEGASPVLAPRAEPLGTARAEPRQRPVTAVAMPFDQPKAQTASVAAPSALAPVPASKRSAMGPLSSFSQPAAARNSVRAVFEIDQLAWPDVCGNLLEGAAEQWSAFSAKIADSAARGQKCLAIGSYRRAEGRTTIALSLAKALAGRGLNCLVVDADFAKPDLALACSVSPLCSWGDVLDGKLPLGEALISASRDRVTLMPWRGIAPSMAQITSARLLSSNFALLREHFDLTILDTMPLEAQSAIADFSDLAQAIDLDQVYLAWDVIRTERTEVVRLCGALRKACLSVAGVIENFVDPLGARGSSPSVASAVPSTLAGTR